MKTVFLSILIMMIHSASGQTLISSICRTSAGNDSNIAYGFCETSLQAAPASQCASIKVLGSISIRLIYNNVTDTRCQVKQLLKNYKFDPYSRQCLKDCLELYSDAIPSAALAKRSYRAGKYDDLNIHVSSIMDAATTCEGGFEEGGVVSPLTKRNNDTFQISAVALSIMNIIQTRSS